MKKVGIFWDIFLAKFELMIKGTILIRAGNCKKKKRIQVSMFFMKTSCVEFQDPSIIHQTHQKVWWEDEEQMYKQMNKHMNEWKDEQTSWKLLSH